MSESIIASEIDREYRARKFYERKKKMQKCKNKSCKRVQVHRRRKRWGKRWTKTTAENYIKTAKQKGLTYWSIP